MSPLLGSRLAKLRSIAQDARAKLFRVNIVVPVNLSAGAGALRLLYCCNNRMIDLYDVAEGALENDNLTAAAILARSVLTTLGFILLVGRRMEGASTVEEIETDILRSTNSNDAKRKLFKNVALKKQLLLTQSAMKQFGLEREPRVSNVIKEGICYYLSKHVGDKEAGTCAELYDRLSEVVHESQISLLYMYTTAGQNIPSSTGLSDMTKLVRHDVWLALSHLNLFESWKESFVNACMDLERL